MQTSPVEVVRTWTNVIRTWMESRGDLDELSGAMAELFDPDAEFYPVRKFPDVAPCHGRDEFAQFVLRFRDAWSWIMDIGELIAVGADRVLVCGSLRTQGHTSRIAMEGELYECYWLRDGRIVRLDHHVTLKGALNSLGLPGETLETAGLRSSA